MINRKKTRLLSELNSSDDNSEPTATSSSSSDDKTSDNNEENITNSSLIETLSQLNGKECRVAFSQSNGSVNYHNGIVMTSETIDSLDDSSEPDMSCLKVKVFFTHPMNNWMLPCPHYMTGKCRFADKCKYSHGYEVTLQDIKPSEPIDYTKISRDSICLAKNKSDGLWYKAIIDGINEEQIVVKYCDSDSVHCVDIEDIIPLDETHCESETHFELPLNDSINDESNELPVIPWNSSSSAAMAEWESHTKGIGSKLMTKMGYVWGQGLGRNGEGIIEPIDVFVFPTGKSLDKCIEMKEKYLTNDELKQKIKNKQKKIENQIANRYNRSKPEDNVFDFINTKIFLKKESSGDHRKTKPIIASELKKSNTQSLNISSLKISEDIRRAEFELKRLNDSLVRNKTKDKVMFTHLQQKVDKQNQLIKSLKQKESLIQREQNLRNNKQKLSVF